MTNNIGSSQNHRGNTSKMQDLVDKHSTNEVHRTAKYRNNAGFWHADVVVSPRIDKVLSRTDAVEINRSKSNLQETSRIG